MNIKVNSRVTFPGRSADRRALRNGMAAGRKNVNQNTGSGLGSMPGFQNYLAYKPYKALYIGTDNFHRDPTSTLTIVFNLKKEETLYG